MGVRSLGNALASFGYKFGTTGLEAVTPAPTPEGLTATGGVISDYTDSGTVYRAHVFTAAGTFIVSDLGNISSNVEYIIVGGGGGGGGGHGPPGNDAEGGGGGAGAVYSTDPAIPSPQRKSAITVSVQSYPIVIGSGGAPSPGPDAMGSNGGHTSALGVTVGGGGGGGSRNAGYPHPNPIPSNQNSGAPGDSAKGPAPSDNAGSGGGGGQRDGSSPPEEVLQDH